MNEYFSILAFLNITFIYIQFLTDYFSCDMVLQSLFNLTLCVVKSLQLGDKNFILRTL